MLHGPRVVLDTRGAGPSDPASKTTFAYVPALECPVAIAAHISARGKTRDTTTKVQAIEAWSR